MTNDSTRVLRWSPRVRARQAAGLIAVAILVLQAAACSSGSLPPAGSGGSASAGGSAGSPSAVAYATCIRSHGVPGYPDPSSNGQLPKGDAQQFGVSPAVFQAAQQGCQHLLPTGGSLNQQASQCMQTRDCSAELVQQMMTADLNLARCMRSHGVPNFPDPARDGSSAPFFPISTAGISEDASRTRRFVAELTECQHLVGDNAPESFG